MMTQPYPIFDYFPALGNHVAPLDFCALPTPVQPMPGLGPHAWVKRDDRSSLAYGGNKVRKLAFILSDVLRHNKTHLITFGGTGTNHGVATAIFCRRLGIRCTILTFPQPWSLQVELNQRLMQEHGATLIPYESLFACLRGFYAHRLKASSGDYLLWAGGSTVLGTLAYINAALELSWQISRGLCPEPEYIFCAVGSQATLAGLSLGIQIAGLNSKIVGVRAAPARLGPFSACTTKTVSNLRRQTMRYLKQISPSAHEFSEQFILLDRYYSPGYGAATPAVGQAIARFADFAGIQLEATYTGKAAAAFLDWASPRGAPVLFWNTFNSLAQVSKNQGLVHQPTH